MLLTDLLHPAILESLAAGAALAAATAVVTNDSRTYADPQPTVGVRTEGTLEPR
ncbi:hypothetical protein ACFC58_36485 [Kitasatospora purpeofusca]|uniref:hypothetical protein n=1 Tax=Kitasatospora purpeofusca TaxID=67352 RepID=UPI0035D56611